MCHVGQNNQIPEETTTYSGQNYGIDTDLVAQKGIIHRMIEFYKRCWVVFLPLFSVLLLGAIQTWIMLEKYRDIATFILLISAGICLIIGIVAFICDFGDARKKEYDKKHPPTTKIQYL
jgi:hypothetical protein